MEWKFSCETKSEISLPPEYTFPQAFNYLNPGINSFYILENKNGYIQCAGSKQQCTVEFREYDGENKFKHFVFYDPTGSNEDVFIEMTNGGVNRKKKHCFGFLKAAKLFKCYYEGLEWPEDVKLEDISSQFE
ncbi:MAG: hypothetical protein OEZ39_16230 [Gammaproteobacteria bacterium]|nr:hypothetical protein [Gammaproteobacteria bacterium]MDH5653407.1 hypothetical protein [Gammaproteobacteria bacterium]